MALGFLYGSGGGNKKSNPVLFENGSFGDGYSSASIVWGSSAPYLQNVHAIDADGIHFYGNSGANSDAVYVTGINLADYEGKNLYFTYKIGTGASQTKAFNITSLSKKPICGVACVYGSGWEYHYGLGISTLAVPTECKSNSDFWDVTYSTGGQGAPSPFLTVEKIWIAD